MEGCWPEPEQGDVTVSAGDPVYWRDDIDALVFEPHEHCGFCMVHRLAFRTLLGFFPQPGDCEAYFHLHASAFHAAAKAKIARAGVAAGISLHLTSRDVARRIRQLGVARNDCFG
jgi:hypothetical protein